MISGALPSGNLWRQKHFAVHEYDESLVEIRRCDGLQFLGSGFGQFQCHGGQADFVETCFRSTNLAVADGHLGVQVQGRWIVIRSNRLEARPRLFLAHAKLDPNAR